MAVSQPGLVVHALGERVEHALKTRRRAIVGSLPVLWFDYARLARTPGMAPPGLTFGSYLRCTYRVPPATRLPVAIARRGAQRLRRALTPGTTTDARARLTRAARG